MLPKREKEGVDMRTLQAKGTKAFLTNWYLSISAVANIWLAPEWLWSMDTANSCVGAYWHMEQVHIRRLEQALNQSVLFLFSLSSKYLKCFAGFYYIYAGFLFSVPRYTAMKTRPYQTYSWKYFVLHATQFSFISNTAAIQLSKYISGTCERSPSPEGTRCLFHFPRFHGVTGPSPSWTLKVH